MAHFFLENLGKKRLYMSKKRSVINKGHPEQAFRPERHTP